LTNSLTWTSFVYLTVKLLDVSRNFVARLYDQKGKMKSAHDNLNRLRVLRLIFQVVALCLTSSRCKSEGKLWEHAERMKLHMVVTLPSLHPSTLHPFTLLVRLLQIFRKICCVHVKANLRVLRVVFVLNKIWPALSCANVKGLMHDVR
jgi:hypothetical protein